MFKLADIFWAAGFLEGEGSFPRSTIRNRMVVQAAQVQRWPLDKLQHLFGGNIIGVKAPKESRQAHWLWHLSGYRAAALMMTIFLLMSPRRQEQIKYAITNWKDRPLQAKLRSVCPKGHPLPPLIKGKRRWCRQCKKDLNYKRKNYKRSKSKHRHPNQCEMF